MWLSACNDVHVKATPLNPDIEYEVKILNFLVHNESKIMYSIRHHSNKLYTFNVDLFVDVMNDLKKKNFAAIETMTNADDDNNNEKRKLVFDIFDIVFKNVHK